MSSILFNEKSTEKSTLNVEKSKESNQRSLNSMNGGGYSNAENQRDTNSLQLPNRKSSLRLAEAAKQKETDAQTALGDALNNSSNDSAKTAKNPRSSITEQEVADKVNEDKKQLRPRPPKPTSIEISTGTASAQSKHINFTLKLDF